MKREGYKPNKNDVGFKLVCLKCGSEEYHIFVHVIECDKCGNRGWESNLVGVEGTMSD